jgi:putative (di)nucleoside polyphosphate hydrolase
VSGEYFRAGAGAVICDARGCVLVLERADVPGAWQLPQGGLGSGEEPLAAALREATEETGIPAEALELLAAYPEPLAYELPPHARSEKTGRGQVQYWFYFRPRAPSVEPRLPEGGEFRAWRWQPFAAVVAEVVAFRRPVYARLERYHRRTVAGS